MRVVSWLICSFLLLAPPYSAWAAIAEVSGQNPAPVDSARHTASATLAYPSAVVANNLLVVTGTVFDDNLTLTSISVTDTIGTSYTVLISTSSLETSRGRSFIAHGLAASSAANTVTVDPNSTSCGLAFGIHEFSGVDTTTRVDAAKVEDFATSGTAATVNITTATANALIVGGVNGNRNSTGTAPGASYTEYYDTGLPASDADHSEGEFRIVTTATTYAADATINNGSAGWIMMAIAFREAGAGASAAPRGMLLGVGP